jgi:hypothetical protein
MPIAQIDIATATEPDHPGRPPERNAAPSPRHAPSISHPMNEPTVRTSAGMIVK